jgi:hypothetical protein
MAGKKEKEKRAETAEYSELGSADTAAQGETGKDACPTFTLRADGPGHLRALMAAFREMPESEQKAAAVTLRAFEMWEEQCRS